MSDTQNTPQFKPIPAHEANVFAGFPLNSASIPLSGKLTIANDLGVYANTGWCGAFLSADRAVQSDLFHSEQMLSGVMWSFLYKKDIGNIYGACINRPFIDLAITYIDTDKRTKDKKVIKTAKRSGRTRLVISHSDPDKRFDLLAISDFIRRIERLMTLDTSAFYPVTDRPNAYAIVASNVWMETPALLTLFGLLLRTGENHVFGTSPLETIDKVSSGEFKPERLSDMDVWARSKAAFARLLSIGYRPYFYLDPVKNYQDTVVDAIGNDWLSFAEGHGTVKYWTRKELASYPTVAERQKARELAKQEGSAEADIAKELITEAQG